MRFVTYTAPGRPQPRLALRTGKGLLALSAAAQHRASSDLLALIQQGQSALEEVAAAIRAFGDLVDEATITYLPPLPAPPRIICVGLNYLDHTAESKFEQPKYPTLFFRIASSFVGHAQALTRPLCSDQFDYEGEMVAVIGRGGKHISKEAALDHVIGYSVSNEGSVRDYQFKSPQWTVGKNFDRSGSIGPDFVTADEVPAGGKGLRIETRLNGVTVQSANTNDMVFDVASVISIVSEAIALEPGDVILMGTPAGVGLARKPPLFMKNGDRVEVEVEGIGRLQNDVLDERI